MRPRPPRRKLEGASCSGGPLNNLPSNSVVVWLDRSPSARATLDWAAREAQLRGAPLRIASSWNTLDYELPADYQEEISDPAYRSAVGLLDESAAAVRACYSGLAVGTPPMSEAVAEGLIDLAARAELVVVGRRGLNTFLTVLLGSVSQRVVAHADVPAVVVPETRPPSPSPRSVVVGVAHGAPGPYAFREARLRGAPLVAVRAWTLPNPYVMASGEATAWMDAEEETDRESMLAEARRTHPTVPVTTRVTSAAAEETLVQAAAEAALVVLGRHRRHARYGLPLGTVPHLADAPVAVAPN